jgi:glycosyltransferase involved in cell wall biosynthesis
MSIRLVHVVTSPLFLNFLEGHVLYLRDKGFDQFVICSPGDLLDRFVNRTKVVGYSVDIPRDIKVSQGLQALHRIWRIFRRIQPHIVHTHTPQASFVGMIASTLCRTPVRIHHNHGLPHLSAVGLKRVVLRYSEKVCCQLSHRVLHVSKSVADVAIQENLCAPHKVKVLANGSITGVDAIHRFHSERFPREELRTRRLQLRIPENAVVVGFVGRLVRFKGVTELSSAWMKLRQDYPDLHLLIVGDFERHDPVPLTVRQRLYGDPRVHLTGWVPDTSPYYPLMQIFVLPSYHEGLPCTLLEAAAMELPVVATRIPGNVDAVEDEVTGLLVPPRDAEALEQAIRRYLDCPELRQQHGKAGRERVLRLFRQEVVWEALYNEYMDLLRQRGILLAEEHAR